MKGQPKTPPGRLCTNLLCPMEENLVLLPKDKIFFFLEDHLKTMINTIVVLVRRMPKTVQNAHCNVDEQKAALTTCHITALDKVILKGLCA